MVEVSRKFIRTEFGQMHIRIAGVNNLDDVPLVCLHMAPQSGQDFETFIKIAGDGKLVIAPDYPGYGDSDPIVDDAKVSIGTYAKSIWQVLNALEIHQVEILGYHTGSKVGVEMASQFPHKVRRLFCIGLSTMTPNEYAAYKPSFQTLTHQESDDRLHKWWQTLNDYYDSDIAYDTLLQKYAISLKSGSRFHLGFQASHEYNANVIEKLRALETPTVIINPDDDLSEISPYAAEYINNTVLIERPQWRPGFLELKADEVLATLCSGIQTLESQGHDLERTLAS